VRIKEARVDKGKRIALYSGSFDPFTNGHKYIADCALKHFDEIIIAIGVNPVKVNKYCFTLEERLKMIEDTFERNKNVKVDSYDDKILRVNFAESKGARTDIRGLREDTDFNKEIKEFNFNRRMNPRIETIFIPSPIELSLVSSSYVKILSQYSDGRRIVKDMVSGPVYEKILEKFGCDI
jgi:pantetheine-phosphate adenylyltransferase